MADLIKVNEDGSLSFGDYTLFEKTKLPDFEFMGNVYKVKTFKELTKFEKNDILEFESEPGTNVSEYIKSDEKLTFMIDGDGLTQVTLGLTDGAQYRVVVGDADLGTLDTSMGGKLVLSVDLTPNEPQRVEVTRV